MVKKMENIKNLIVILIILALIPTIALVPFLFNGEQNSFQSVLINVLSNFLSALIAFLLVGFIERKYGLFYKSNTDIYLESKKAINESIDELKDIIEEPIEDILESVKTKTTVNYDFLSKFKGEWVEYIGKNDSGRRFCLAQFKFNENTNSFEFDGENYKSDGQANYEWRSISMTLSEDKQEIFYIYKVRPTEISEKGYETKYGFGVIYVSGRHKLKRGLFVDTGDPENPKRYKIYPYSKVVEVVNKDSNQNREYKDDPSALIEYLNSNEKRIIKKIDNAYWH